MGNIFGGPQPLKPSPGPDFIWNGSAWVRKPKPAAPPAPAPKPPAPPSTATPYDPGYDQATNDLIGALKGGPDYSGVPQWSEEEMSGNAKQYAEDMANWAAEPYKDLQEATRKAYEFSAKMGANFGAAVASVFSGGNTTEAGAQAYAEKQYGSKYAIAAAVQAIGYELMSKIQNASTASELRIAEKIADIYSQRPDIYESRMKDLLGRIAEARDLADVSYKDKIETYALLRSTLSEERQRVLNERGILYEQQFGQWQEKNRTKEEKAKLAFDKWKAKQALNQKNLDRLADMYEAATDSGSDPANLQVKNAPDGSQYIFNPETGETWDYAAAPPGEADPSGMSVTEARGLAKDRTTNGNTIWDVKKLPDGSYRPVDTGRPKPVEKADKPENTRQADRQSAQEDVFRRAEQLVSDGITGTKAWRALRQRFYTQLHNLGYTDQQVDELLWRALRASPAAPATGGGARGGAQGA